MLSLTCLLVCDYLSCTQSRFASDERVYKAFLEILNMYRKGQKSITQVYDEVRGCVIVVVV
jgi:histone deacetylase complex regulatory component SIN3